MICGMLPDLLLPVLIAPFIDRSNKKFWIVGLDILMALFYAGMGLWTLNHKFNYGIYIAFVLIISVNSIFYQLAYGAWYPDLIPKGAEQQGYAVSSTIYPLIVIIVAPISTFIYGKIAIGYIFLFVAFLTIVSVVLEAQITCQSKKSEKVYTFTEYKEDIKGGFQYLKKEKGIRNIYTYMSITNGASNGVNLITQSYYQTQPWLTVTMLGFLKSAEMIGRVLSGLIVYKFEVPRKKRFVFTKAVYLTYDTMDSIFLFLPFPLMIISRFICGGLGCASATIRQSAINSYLPENIRARVNAIFNVIFSIGGILFQLAAGWLGTVLPYRAAALLLGLLTLVSVFIFIIIPGKHNRPVYEA